ncbi:PqqD family protein [Bacteroides sp. UBA939]|uniref:PqqD family protein n=1 Tax=Bacteroides sp. UBA939 TaxID=1946092 RepID=UPI0025BF0DE0|nr:PqqD family protein [Bacteroides sp. UBA939]
MGVSKEKVNLLDAIPVCCNHVTTEWEDDCAVIVYPRFKHGWMRRFLLPKGMSPDIHVRLEEHGTAVWRLIDGKRTVQEIISLLDEHFQSDENYSSRITAYVMQLQKDGFIRLRIGVRVS